MALNLQNLRVRSLSAVFYVLIFLGSILINEWLFLLFVLFVHVGCWVEFLKLSAKINGVLLKNTTFHNIGIVFSGSAFVLFLTGDFYKLPFISLGELGWWLLLISVLILPIMDILFSKEFYVEKIYYDVLGFLYLSISLAMFVQLKIHTLGLYGTGFLLKNIVVLIMIGSIWLNDSMAYIGGSIFGRTPFFPSISPKKTWEGSIFGVLGSVGVGFVVFYYYFREHLVFFLLIVLLSAILGTIGDLVESKIKRLAGVKDSGHIMPGHGGFLDRFDSLLFACPFVWLIIYLF